ncbi:Endoglucanase H precursor [Caloramator mitchellensis]|uniref:Endoglucanase H n=1 Tax=Caloramator mitchellensis TaxID=908809 RepID=A0A0R3K2S9_CALMK|nr:glycosyl hydrolase [Caloramator mitchellensis]KRQ87301.1 Endoglucanase H precursor [Caloramator mitchellensis]
MKKVVAVLLVIFLIINFFSPTVFSTSKKTTYYDLWLSSKYEQTLYKTNSRVVYSRGKYKLTNYNHGYSFQFPKDFNFDIAKDKYYVRLFNKSCRIDLYHENLTNKNINTYIDDLTKSIRKNIIFSRYAKINNYNVRIIGYERKNKLFEGDLNYYHYYIINYKNKVLLIQLKTDLKNLSINKKTVDQIIKTINFNERKKVNNYNFDYRTVSGEINYLTNGYKLSIPKEKFVFGTFHEHSRDIDKLEKTLETRIGAQMFYKNINQPYDSYTEELVSKGKIPIVTFLMNTVPDSSESYVEKVIKGEFDNTLLTWVENVKKLNAPVLFRIGNEMNGEWTFWSLKYTYNDPDLYKLAFAHIVNLFKTNGCNNAYFVWNPNNKSIPNYIWNDAVLFYPGNKFVDIIGMTAYNFGNTKYSKFSYFDELYSDMYKTYLLNYPNKPMMIGEFASVSSGGDRPLFIKDMFEKIKTKYKNIKIVIWFNKNDGEYDFDLMNSDLSIKALKEGLKQDWIIKEPIQKN